MASVVTSSLFAATILTKTFYEQTTDSSQNHLKVGEEPAGGLVAFLILMAASFVGIYIAGGVTLCCGDDQCKRDCEWMMWVFIVLTAPIALVVAIPVVLVILVVVIVLVLLIAIVAVVVIVALVIAILVLVVLLFATTPIWVPIAIYYWVISDQLTQSSYP